MARLVKFIDINRGEVWVNPEFVSWVRGPMAGCDGEPIPGKSHIAVSCGAGNYNIAVDESPETVARMLMEAT